MFQNKGENQIKEIIKAACFSVFFLDEDQRIHWRDVGEGEEIVNWAKKCRASVTELALESQFRCNGSDGYLSWVDNLLHIRDTAQTTLEGINYEFKVCDSASELRDLIYARNRESNKARMVAGYCWDWVSKNNPKLDDIAFIKDGFSAKWNLKDDGSLWILKPDSVTEVGCIHTCQGLELDYIGVILGKDLLVRNGVVMTDGGKRSKHDASIKGYKKFLKQHPKEARKKADSIIKNTYRTLMMEGLKGCYVYSVDPETNTYLKEASQGALFESAQDTNTAQDCLPFCILDPGEVQPYVNAVPKFDFEIAAGEFSPEQHIEDHEWVALPEYFAVKKGYFVARVVGESMNRKIPNGSWCLFRETPAGSRQQGKILLVQHRDIQDPDYGGQFTIKLYRSEKVVTDEGWVHSKIILSPLSDKEVYHDIILVPDEVGDLKAIGEFITVL